MPKYGGRQNKQQKGRKRLRQEKRAQNDSEHVLDFPTQIIKRKAQSPISPLTEAQGQMISQIVSKDIIFVNGCAGTGKTYVSAALAAEALENNQIEKIIITRPMQGCDEDMGFLPGDESEKYAPWCEPVMDVLEERLGKSYVKNLIKLGRIQCKPLMFMRGKSLSDAWILADEMQNATPDQMKMLLTRIAENSKLIIDGDIKQSDLKDGRGVRQLSGLTDALSKLKGIPEIGFVEFTRDDIVRHGIIRKILDRYEG